MAESEESGARMKILKSNRRYRLQRAAAGPVSFLGDDGAQQTMMQNGARVMASTARTMLARGWRLEVL